MFMVRNNPNIMSILESHIAKTSLKYTIIALRRLPPVWPDQRGNPMARVHPLKTMIFRRRKVPSHTSFHSYFHRQNASTSPTDREKTKTARVSLSLTSASAHLHLPPAPPASRNERTQGTFPSAYAEILVTRGLRRRYLET